MIRQVRHLNSTVHHAFGYAYVLTGNDEYLRMGDEVFDASYGEKVDGIHGQADTGRGKDYAMNYRASGRYLVWRLAGARTRAASDAQQASGARQAAPPASDEETKDALPSALSLAQGLSKSSAQSGSQVESLINRVEGARREFVDAGATYESPEEVLSELDAALQHLRNALEALKVGDADAARLREGWAAARLKRAVERARRR